MSREWGIADNADVPHCWGELNEVKVLVLPITDENITIVQGWAETGLAPIGFTMDRGRDICVDDTYCEVCGQSYGEASHEDCMGEY